MKVHSLLTFGYDVEDQPGMNMLNSQKNDQTDEILALDKHLVHSFADLHSLAEPDARTVITQAEGAYVFDARGERYLDGMAGLWCVNVGHGRREISAAIADQLNTLDYFSTFYNLTHPTAATLAAKIAKLAPGTLNHVYFGNSGSVANDTAIRIVHYYFNRLGKPSKRKILSRIGAYHGSTHLAIAMTTPAYREGWNSADELVHFLPSPDVYRRPDEMSEAQFCDHLLEDMRAQIEVLGADTIACFIAEPIMGAGGVIVAPQGYHARVLSLCHEFEILYISDEVVTAFGRLGHMFASEAVFGIVPDIICSAKGLSSGYQPISATILSEEIYDVISAEGGKFLHGMTYSGHPACCAASLENIRIIEDEKICERVLTLGPLFEASLKRLLVHAIVGDVRGSHFMMAVEFVKNRQTKEAFHDDIGVGMRISRHAQSLGLIVRPLGSMIVLSPPLILTEKEIDDVGRILSESIEATMRELVHEQLL
ncbi:MAG: adenosylmethionine-8-amino-7-oxononanoate aminotransferase [Granulosicoccus sp.]